MLLLLVSCGTDFAWFVSFLKVLLLETLDPKLREESLIPDVSSVDAVLSCLLNSGVGSGEGQGVGRGVGSSLIGERHFPKLNVGTSSVIVGGSLEDCSSPSGLSQLSWFFFGSRGLRTETCICDPCFVFSFAQGFPVCKERKLLFGVSGVERGVG